MKKTFLAVVSVIALMLVALAFAGNTSAAEPESNASYVMEAFMELDPTDRIPLTIITEEPLEIAEIEPIEVELPQIDAEAILAEEERRNNEEVQCLARNIYFESRGEPLLGRYAVANVTMNRVASDRFPDSVCDVVHQRNRRACQFSWVCKPARVTEMAAYEDAVDIAVEVYYDEINDITQGAQYFHADYVRPRWASVFDRTYRVGRHIFYRE